MKRRVFKRDIINKLYSLSEDVAKEISEAYERGEDSYELTILFSIGLADYYSNDYNSFLKRFLLFVKRQLKDKGIKYLIEDELKHICQTITFSFEREIEGFSKNEIFIMRLIKKTGDEDLIDELNNLLLRLRNHPEKADKIIKTAKSIVEDY